MTHLHHIDPVLPLRTARRGLTHPAPAVHFFTNTAELATKAGGGRAGSTPPLGERIPMLVLSRQKNETIMVGDFEVTVVDIRGDKVRLGVTAPKTVAVHRKEIYQAIRREERERAAATATPPAAS